EGLPERGLWGWPRLGEPHTSAVSLMLAPSRLPYVPRVPPVALLGKVTASTFALEGPRCVFDGHADASDAVWLAVAFANASAAFRNPLSRADVPPYKQLPTARSYMTLETAAAAYSCSAPSPPVLRVGGDTACRDQGQEPHIPAGVTRHPALVRGPVSAPYPWQGEVPADGLPRPQKFGGRRLHPQILPDPPHPPGPPPGAVPLCSPTLCSVPENHGTVWVGRDHKHYLVSTRLPRAGTSSARCELSCQVKSDFTSATVSSLSLATQGGTVKMGDIKNHVGPWLGGTWCRCGGRLLPLEGLWGAGHPVLPTVTHPCHKGSGSQHAAPAGAQT
uniref:Uroplakin 3B n=1 Tax=Ficedula albicollis TaxID=59894 RepID=A0A803WFQ6_FICAL